MTARRVDGALVADPGRLRLAVLRSDDPHHRYLEAELAARFELAGVVVESGRRQRARLWNERRRRSWAWREYHLARQRFTGRTRYARRHFADTRHATSVPRLDVGWINAPEVVAALGEWQPDLTVVCGTGLLRPETIAVAGTAVNVHGGCLPWYRGNHGVFFAYERGDFARVGASVHLVDARIDHGDLIDVVRPDVFPGDDDGQLYCRSVEVAIARLCRRLADLEHGLPVPCSPQPDVGRTFRHRDRTPGRELRLWLRRRAGLHRVPRLRPADGTD